MSFKKTAGVVCGFGLALSLLMARAHPFGDAGLYAPAKRQGPLMAGTDITPEARAILEKKCLQCHSNESDPPIYGRFAPVSWMVEKHVLAGRKELNFDEWNSYSEDRQQVLKAKVVQLTKNRSMPIKSYLLIHWNARITDDDVKALTVWERHQPPEEAEESAPSPVAAAAPAKVAVVKSSQEKTQAVAVKTAPAAAAQAPANAAVVSTALLEADATRGQAVYAKRCAGCHALDENKDGPKLRGIYGKMSAEVPGFDYSKALKGAQIRWDDALLDRWLTDPDAMVPDNDMSYRVRSAQERLDLIRYLQTLGQ